MHGDPRMIEEPDAVVDGRGGLLERRAPPAGVGARPLSFIKAAEKESVV